MSPYQVSYLKTIVPAGFVALCTGVLTTLWLIRMTVVLPFWSISAVAYPVTFWFMVVVGVVTMALSCLVALAGVLCLRRTYQAQKSSPPSCEKTEQIEGNRGSCVSQGPS